MYTKQALQNLPVITKKQNNCAIKASKTGLTKTKTAEERRTWRSKTFPGIARAISEQWTIQVALEEGLLTKKELAFLGNDYQDLNPKDKHDQLEIEEREQNLIEYWSEK